ncbi:creatininase family protein [Flavihumibacter sp. R14]|nr:creatininase family protein [Flavihumibacter soli]
MRIFIFLVCITSFSFAQELPARWDELTAPDWSKALDKSSKTCILPIGILEKHGPHSPLGTDLIHVREVAARVVKNEYAVVFPDYFYGQINEARQQPGTFALPSRLIYELLEATCEEIARNGFDKIVILNGHGGNPEFLHFFMQSQLNKRKNYVVYLYDPEQDPEYSAKYKKLSKSDPAGDMHAGERETSTMLFLTPELMRMGQAEKEDGSNRDRLKIPGVYTPIWWYAGFPNHYAGEGGKATTELGKLIAEHEISSFSKVLKAVKADTKALELQNEYYDRVEKVIK